MVTTRMESAQVFREQGGTATTQCGSTVRWLIGINSVARAISALTPQPLPALALGASLT